MELRRIDGAGATVRDLSGLPGLPDRYDRVESLSQAS